MQVEREGSYAAGCCHLPLGGGGGAAAAVKLIDR